MSGLDGYWSAFNQSKGVVDQMVAGSKQNALEAAMRGYATNPDDPNAVNALIQADPRMGMQVQQQRAQAQAQGAEQYQGTIKTAAEMIRNLKTQNPQMSDEQIYGTVRQTLIANRAPGADQAPAQFDPQYYQGLLSMAGGQKAGSQPADVQEYEYAKGQGYSGTYMDFKEAERGPMIANNGDGTFTLIPRGAGGQVQGAAPPPPPGFQIDAPGGQTPPASGSFLDPLAPRP